MREVAITGFGVLLPGCDHPDVFWQQLRDGESQLALKPDPSDPSRKVAMGTIDGFVAEKYLPEIPERVLRQYDREVQLYLASLYSALRHSGLGPAAAAGERVGLFDGCSRPMFAGWYDRLQRHFTAPETNGYTRRDLMLATPGQAVGVAAALLEVHGSAYTYASTCSSGGVALGHAFREVSAGIVDLALATGHESNLLQPLYAMYHDAGLVSPEAEDPARAVRPFSDCLGNAFGEGAVTLVLEPLERARARGATCYAVLSAYHYGNNGFHPTCPDLAGGQPARLIRSVIGDSQLTNEDVGFVVGHGNGVQLSDPSEENYMALVFGEKARQVPLLSNKPIYGHTLGASSALNAAAAALMLHHQYVVPTLNVVRATANLEFEHMANGGEARALNAGIAVSFGLGGHNAVLAFKKAER